ncbi:MAG: histidinol-phosphate transaminase [Candidatus Omnitrophota bacterium]
MKNMWELLKICVTKTPWRKIINFIPIYKPGKPIEEVKRELGLDNVVKLASNENAMDPSPKVVEAIASEAKKVNRYPDGWCFYLRKALSEKLSIDEDNLIFGNGSDELISLALRAFVERGDEVVIADPTFLIYRLASVIAGAKVRLVPLKDYKYDLKGMLKAVNSRTKVIFIANPDNPTGSYVTQQELDEFIEKVPKDILIFLDEAYYEFAVGGDYPESIGLIKREDRNIIITRTFSKAYGLAGLRVGYGIARKDLMMAINKAREPFNVNSLAQAAAIAALDDDEYRDASVALIREGKEKLYKKFDSLGIKYIPSKTNFILLETNRDSTQVFEAILKKGVIIRDISPWGLKGCIRVNIGLPEENEMFLKAFEEVLKEIPEIKETA